MTRISRNDMLMGMAGIVSQRSTCARSNVGAIVAIQGRCLVSGYNGAPMGMPHCNHTCDCWNEPISERGSIAFWSASAHMLGCPAQLPCKIAVHAEANAVAFAARYGVRLAGASLFTTLEPCLACAMLIINSGIVEVVYSTSYRDHAGFRLLTDAGIKTWMWPGQE